jgi:hypothetical protein
MRSREARDRKMHFSKLQIRSIMQQESKCEISFAKWLMGKNTGKLEVIMPKI